MEIFGVGPVELLVIVVIALIVFGPGRLPEIGAALGRAIGDLRRASSAFTADLQSVAKVGNAFQEALSSTQVDLREAANTVEREAKALSAEVNAAPATAVSAPPAKQEPPADDPDTRWLRLGSATEEDGGGTT